MSNLFDVLARDHEEVRHMLAELENSDPAAARMKMAEQLIIAESRHEAVEEMYFWPTVRQKVIPDGDVLADKAMHQERLGKGILEKLGSLSPGDPEFESLLTTFTAAARAHIEFEETQVWPGLRAALTAAAAQELGMKVHEAKKTAPTRPHPLIPDSPVVLKAAGPSSR